MWCRSSCYHNNNSNNKNNSNGSACYLSQDRCIFLLYTIFVLSFGTTHGSPPTFTQEFLNITEIAADLSLLTYIDRPDNRGGYDSLRVYIDEPDRAILAQKSGYCFLAFRGTDFSRLRDVHQWIQHGKDIVCPMGGAASPNCCETRSGFAAAYRTSYQSTLEEDLRDCTKTCTDPTNCVIMTGHSSGGSIAQVAAVVWHDVNPWVISFGSTPALNPECTGVDRIRWFHYVNTRRSWRGQLLYDQFPFLSWDRGLVNLGYVLVLSDDTSGIANLGLNLSQKPGPVDQTSLFTMHKITTGSRKYPGYRDRIKTLVATTNAYHPLRNGFAPDFPCQVNAECQSRQCTRRGLVLKWGKSCAAP